MNLLSDFNRLSPADAVRHERSSEKRADDDDLHNDGKQPQLERHGGLPSLLHPMTSEKSPGELRYIDCSVNGRHDIPVATQEPGQRGRPRRQRTDDQIIEAALALVREGGPQKVTVGSVAARSAVARTTIYRRYRDRDELLRTALNRIADQAVPPNHLSVGEKLRWVLTRVRVVLEEGLGRGGVAAVLADSDPQFTEAFRSALALHLEPLKVSIAVDTDSGFLRPDVDADVAVNLFFGAYLGEVLRYGEPRPDWLDRTLNMLALALYAPDQQ